MSTTLNASALSRNVKRTQWKNVERLYVNAVWSQDGVPCYFTVDVAYHTGSMRCLTPRCSIDAARRICATLGAIHDVPVRDWTLPAPPTLETSEAFPLPFGLLDNPVWGYGWHFADRFFRDGLDRDQWQGAFLNLLRMNLEAHMLQGMSAERAQEEADKTARIARDRWLLLTVANPKPETAR